MGFPLFRFTLNNAIEGELEIKEPDGWDNGVLKLERNEDYHSVVEYYDQPLLYDEAQAYDTLLGQLLTGGQEYIRNIEYTQGVDAIITITIEISNDQGVTFETIFDGVIDIPTVKETDFYKQEQGVKRDDFWSKFINRKSIPVDLLSTVDMDGNAIDSESSQVLTLSNQVIDLRFSGGLTTDYNYPVNSDTYAVIDFDEIILDEIQTKYNYPLLISNILPFELFAFDFAGDIDVDSEIIGTCVFAGSFYPIMGLSNLFDIYIQINDDTPQIFTAVDTIANNGLFDYEVTTYSFTDTFIIEKGDKFRIYMERNSGTGGISQITLGSSSYLDITQHSTYPTTSTDYFTLFNAAENCISKYVGIEGVIESDFLTSGCGQEFAVMKGLHVRGYSIFQKPFAMSFDQWWNGANPIFNLGLGYEQGQNKIRIEKKDYFYNPTIVVSLDFVNNIERSYSSNHIFKSIEIGYNKWSAESASGIDDPQSKRIWRTRFATVGKDEKILSTFFAASLGIEQTRRNRVEQGKDWRLDDEIIIIATNSGVPEFDENFNSITGLLNEDARYNIRLSVARNFQRWKNYFNGCLQIPSGEEFLFASGEGNFDMTTQLEDSDCEAISGTEPTIDEKGDVDVTGDFLFLPIVYEFEHPLTFEQYKQIRDNRHNAIGVSRTDTGHRACHLLNLDYRPTRGLGTFTVILGENDPL